MKMGNKPVNHVSRFHFQWWTERRKRDYYIDDDGCVQLDPQSPTGRDLAQSLRVEAMKQYAKLGGMVTDG